MIRVVVVDDHPVVRTGLKHILMQASDMDVVGEAEDARSAIKLVRENPCDAVVLDITMPGVNGIDLLKQLKNEYPGLSVLVLSVHPEDQYAIRAIRAGALGYLRKDSPPDELLKAVRLIGSGRRYITSSLAERLAEQIELQKNPLHQKLSDREFEIMHMIAEGRHINEIAQELHISDKTVSTYRARILDKMNMKTNAELTAYAIRNALIEQ